MCGLGRDAQADVLAFPVGAGGSCRCQVDVIARRGASRIIVAAQQGGHGVDGCGHGLARQFGKEPVKVRRRRAEGHRDNGMTEILDASTTRKGRVQSGYAGCGNRERARCKLKGEGPGKPVERRRHAGGQIAGEIEPARQAQVFDGEGAFQQGRGALFFRREGQEAAEAGRVLVRPQRSALESHLRDEVQGPVRVHREESLVGDQRVDGKSLFGKRQRTVERGGPLHRKPSFFRLDFGGQHRVRRAAKGHGQGKLGPQAQRGRGIRSGRRVGDIFYLQTYVIHLTPGRSLFRFRRGGKAACRKMQAAAGERLAFGFVVGEGTRTGEAGKKEHGPDGHRRLPGAQQGEEAVFQRDVRSGQCGRQGEGRKREGLRRSGRGRLPHKQGRFVKAHGPHRERAAQECPRIGKDGAVLDEKGRVRRADHHFAQAGAGEGKKGQRRALCGQGQPLLRIGKPLGQNPGQRGRLLVDDVDKKAPCERQSPEEGKEKEEKPVKAFHGEKRSNRLRSR